VLVLFLTHVRGTEGLRCSTPRRQSPQSKPRPTDWHSQNLNLQVTANDCVRVVAKHFSAESKPLNLHIAIRVLQPACGPKYLVKSSPSSGTVWSALRQTSIESSNCGSDWKRGTDPHFAATISSRCGHVSSSDTSLKKFPGAGGGGSTG